MAVVRHLIVTEKGAFVGRHQGRVQVSQAGKVVRQAPLLHLETVLLADRSIAVSTDVLAACAGAGIPVYMVDGRGRPCAALYAAGLTGTVRTRSAQFHAYDSERGVRVARALARAKVLNGSGLLRYMAKYRKEGDPATYETVRATMTEMLVWEAALATTAPDATGVDSLREPLMVAEAHAARHYWRGFGALLPAESPWLGRLGRGSRDPVNSLLNYGYGMLYNEVERAIVLAGLDPYAGFIHADRPGKYSLVLDVIEPFRHPVVDRAVLNFLGKGAVVEQDAQGMLSEKTRTLFAERVLDRLDRPLRQDGEQTALRAVIQQSARALALYLRGDHATYDAWLARW